MSKPFSSIIVLSVCGVLSLGVAASGQQGSISGHVTASLDAAPLSSVYVEAYRWDEGWEWWKYAGFAFTGVDGGYLVSDLEDGTYRLGFWDYGRNVYAAEYYNDASSVETGQDIIVAGGAAIGGIDVALNLASTIAGTVTGSSTNGIGPVAGVQVAAYAWNSVYGYWSWKAGSTSGDDGTYLLGGLPAGAYRIRFDSEDYIVQVYNDKLFLDDGDDVVLAVGEDIRGIDARLHRGSSIEGSVTARSDGSPISNAWMHVQVTTDDLWVWASARTDDQGGYRIHGLVPGDYAIYADPPSQSDYVSEWYDGIVRTPWQMDPPANATILTLDGDETRSGIDFSLGIGGRVSGRISAYDACPVPDAEVEVRGTTNNAIYYGWTDPTGAYDVRGLAPDTYFVKATADDLADRWYDNADHLSRATPVSLSWGESRTIDFALRAGQSPALVAVSSTPAGASIYLDYQPTGRTTPATIDIGECGPASWALELRPHTISVKRAGSPQPPPNTDVPGIEAETVDVTFDLTPAGTSRLEIATSPAGATVFVDSADTPVGVSPVTLDNLLPGSHTILLRRDGYLLPRPIITGVQSGQTVQVSLPLTPTAVAGGGTATVRTVPVNAQAYVDYLSPPQTTDVLVEGLDPAYYSGAGWRSVSHTILIRKIGYMPAAPRDLSVASNTVSELVVNLILDPAAVTDSDHDGLPDEWEDSYELNEKAPDACGADDDADGDGMPNIEEMRAGTNPLDATDGLGIVGGDGQGQPPDGNEPKTFRIVFRSVPHRRYMIQASSDLADGVWTTISRVIEAKGYITEYVAPIQTDGDARCFRVLVLGR